MTALGQKRTFTDGQCDGLETPLALTTDIKMRLPTKVIRVP
jgi:hypothetical protein